MAGGEEQVGHMYSVRSGGGRWVPTGRPLGKDGGRVNDDEDDEDHNLLDFLRILLSTQAFSSGGTALFVPLYTLSCQVGNDMYVYRYV